MKAKIKQKSDGFALTLPSSLNLADNEELEVIMLQDGLFMLAKEGVLDNLREDKKERAGQEKSKEEKTQQKQQALEKKHLLSRAEVDVLKKISAIRFEERTVPFVMKQISPVEKKLLDGLVERKIIEVYVDKKYPNGVYNLSERLFRFLSNSRYLEKDEKEKKSSTQSIQSTAPKQPQAKQAGKAAPDFASTAREQKAPLNTIEHLQKYGYMILNDENEARALMDKIQQMQKSEGVRGIRGFDKKYYVLRRSFLSQHQAKIIGRLNRGDTSIDELSEELKIEPDAIKVILEILADDGEVLEKRKGIWCRA